MFSCLLLQLISSLLEAKLLYNQGFIRWSAIFTYRELDKLIFYYLDQTPDYMYTNKTETCSQLKLRIILYINYYDLSKLGCGTYLFQNQIIKQGFKFLQTRLISSGIGQFKTNLNNEEIKLTNIINYSLQVILNIAPSLQRRIFWYGKQSKTIPRHL